MAIIEKRHETIQTNKYSAKHNYIEVKKNSQVEIITIADTSKLLVQTQLNLKLNTSA